MKQSTESVELRIVVPRSQLPVTAPPEYYSQLNCELLGINRRIYLELLRRPGAPAATRIGKLRLVHRDAMLEYMRRLADLAPKPVEELDGGDRVLMEIGAVPRKRKTGS